MFNIISFALNRGNGGGGGVMKNPFSSYMFNRLQSATIKI